MALSTNECLYSIAVIIVVIVIFVVVVFIIIKLTHSVALKSDVPFLGWHCRRGFCLPKNEQTTDRPNEQPYAICLLGDVSGWYTLSW